MPRSLGERGEMPKSSLIEQQPWLVALVLDHVAQASEYQRVVASRMDGVYLTVKFGKAA